MQDFFMKHISCCRTETMTKALQTDCLRLGQSSGYLDNISFSFSAARCSVGPEFSRTQGVNR